jgi:proton-translocating NADH-quinone oxidoreductase chain N
MCTEAILLSIIFVPLAGSFLLPLIGRFSARLRNYAAFGLVLATFLLAAALIPMARAGQTVSFSRELVFGSSSLLYADGLAVFMAAVASFISLLIVFYSFGYIDHYEHQSEYYFMVVFFLGAMMGLVMASNLLVLYVFWELTAIASWRLIGFFRDKQQVMRADKAFLMTFFGAVVMLIGFIVVYQQTGSFDFAIIKAKLAGGTLSNLAVFLILFGILSKSATLPFHTWLPDAGVAPSPVTALLHAAILVKIGVYVFARLFVATFPIEQIWHTVVPIIAAVSAIVAAGAALIETDIKRIIAYSTISQIGFIFFGLATGNMVGVAGGLLYILAHGLSKAGLFLCAGIVEQNTKIKDITRLGGLIKTMPFTAIAFLACSFSVMGIPPFSGFFAKYMVFAGGIQAGQTGTTIFFMVGAFMTILYLLRVFHKVFMGETGQSMAAEGSAGMVFTVVVFAALSLLSGILISYPAQFVQTVLLQLPGVK